MTSNQKTLKEIANELTEIKGNVRGATLLTHKDYIMHRKGKEGLKAVEEKIKELGYSFSFGEIKPLEWYPVAIGCLIVLTAYKIFNWEEADIFDMGKSAARFSFFVKILTKYFISIEAVYENASKYWERHFDFGKLEKVEFNKEKKYSIIRLKGYKTHPLLCIHLTGYFLATSQLVIQNSNITIKETKCMHKGDPYHEWLIRWE